MASHLSEGSVGTLVCNIRGGDASSTATLVREESGIYGGQTRHQRHFRSHLLIIHLIRTKLDDGSLTEKGTVHVIEISIYYVLLSDDSDSSNTYA